MPNDDQDGATTSARTTCPDGRTRRLPGDAAAEDLTRSFAGFDDVVTNPQHVAGIILRRHRQLGLPTHLAQLAAAVLDWTLDKGRRRGPLMCEASNAQLADRLDKSPRAISKGLRELRARGLLCVRYGAGNQRHCLRDGDRRVVEWHGIDVRSLLAWLRSTLHALDELRALKRSARAALADAARHLRDARRSLENRAPDDRHATMTTAIDDGEAGLDQARRSVAALELDDDLAAALQSARRQAHAAAQLLRAVEDPVDDGSSKASTDSSAGEPCDGAFQRSASEKVRRSGRQGTPPRGACDAVMQQRRTLDPRALVSLHPEILAVTGLAGQASDKLSSGDIAVAGRRIALGLGLDPATLAAATYRHGSTVVTLAALVARLKPADELRATRAGYLAGLLRRGPDELRLASELRRFARRHATVRSTDRALLLSELARQHAPEHDPAFAVRRYTTIADRPGNRVWDEPRAAAAFFRKLQGDGTRWRARPGRDLWSG